MHPRRSAAAGSSLAACRGSAVRPRVSLHFESSRRTLGDRLSRGPLPVIEALATASQIARGLAHAHERGSVHRDIKPANVMLTVEGVVKILDFGIVKHGEQGLTRTGVTVGTLPYMSPEQLRRDPLDARTDIWSLGVVIHEMLTGCRPFERDDDHALRDAIVFSQPDSLRAWRPSFRTNCLGSSAWRWPSIRTIGTPARARSHRRSMRCTRRWSAAGRARRGD